MIEQLSVFLENKPGHLAQLTRTLADAGINMRALMVADTSEFGVVRIICDRPHAAKATLETPGSAFRSRGSSPSRSRIVPAVLPRCSRRSGCAASTSNTHTRSWSRGRTPRSTSSKSTTQRAADVLDGRRDERGRAGEALRTRLRGVDDSAVGDVRQVTARSVLGIVVGAAENGRS